MAWSPVLPTAPPLLAVPGWFAVLILSGAGAIPSAQAFGNAEVAFGANAYLAVTGIPSAQAFGTTAVGRGAVNLTATGIPSAEAFGTTSVKQSIVPTGIASAQAVGTPTLAVGAVNVVPVGIASGEAFGTATAQGGPVSVFVSGIASAEAVGSPTVPPPASPWTNYSETNTPRTNQAVPTASQFKGIWFTGIGAGGGGGSGRYDAASANITGGTGGGAGGMTKRVWIPKASLGSTYSVAVQTGASAGGAARTSTNNGLPGTTGANTVFSSGSITITANGGVQGLGGTAATPAGGAGGSFSGTGVTVEGDAGTAGGGSAANAAGGAGVNNGATNSGGAGGGGGGGSNIASSYDGGKGGDTNGQAGGVGGTLSVAATNGAALVAGTAGSGGGGGGRTNPNAGNGVGYGAGGGGGGAGRGATSGIGGTGGPGYALLEFTDVSPDPQVEYDSVGAGKTGSTASLTWSHTVGASAKAVVVALTQITYGTIATATVTFGGVSMVPLGSQNYDMGGYPSNVRLFGLINPPTGVQSVVATWSVATYGAGNSVAYNKVDSFGTAVGNTGSGTAMSHTVASAPNDRVAQVFSGGNVTGSFSAYNKNQRWNVPYANGVNVATLMGDADGAASVAFSATAPSMQWASLAVPLTVAPTTPTFDAISAGNAVASSATNSCTVTATAGSYVIVYVVTNGNNAVSGVTYDGNAMTLLGQIANGGLNSNGILRVYGINGVAGGTKTATVTFSGTPISHMQAVAYKNVTSAAAATTASGTSTAIYHSAPCSATQKVVNAITNFSGGSALSALSGGTNRYNVKPAGTFCALAVSDATVQPDAEFVATITSTSPSWAAACVVLS